MKPTMFIIKLFGKYLLHYDGGMLCRYGPGQWELTMEGVQNYDWHKIDAQWICVGYIDE